MRNNSYDYLSSTVIQLKERMQWHQEKIEKADIHDMNSLHDCKSAFDDVNFLCKSAFTQFEVLRRDYNTGRIPLTRYKDFLKPLHNLLTEGEKKITNPELHSEIIAMELKRFF